MIILFTLPAALNAQTLNKKRVKFGDDFVKAVNAKKRKKVLRMCDESYRKDQLKFLNGDEEQFLDELFSGIDQDSEEYVSVKFDDIQSFELVEIGHEDVEGVVYQFIIRSNGKEILITLLLTVHGKTYGFEGASG